jgi:hypothetical protein
VATCWLRLADLRARVWAHEQELRDYLGPAELFEREPANAGAALTIEAALRERLAAHAPAADCRGLVCRIRLDVREEVERHAWEDPFQEIMSRRCSTLVQEGDPPGRALPAAGAEPARRRFAFLTVLRDREGQAVAYDPEHEDPRRPHGLPATPPAALPDDPGVCAAQTVDLERRLRDLAARLDERRPLAVEFLRGADNPALTEELVRELRRALGDRYAAAPTAVACRSDVCAIRRSEPAHPLGLLRRLPDLERLDPFFSTRLETRSTAARPPPGRLEQVQALLPVPPVPVTMGGTTVLREVPPVLYRVLPPGRATAASVLRPFLRQLHGLRLDEGCPREGEAAVAMTLSVPPSGAPAAGPGRVVAVTGADESTPYARCVIANVRARAAAFAVPPETAEGAIPLIYRLPRRPDAGP